MSVVTTSFALLAKVIAGTSVIDGNRVFPAPYERKQKITPGEVWLSGDGQIVGIYRESNQSFPVVEYRWIMLHHLTDPRDSNSYRIGVMLTDQEFLLKAASYRDVYGVFEVEDPVLTSPVDRFGNVMEYVVAVRITINPSP